MVVENKKEEIAEVDLKDWWEAIKVGYKNADNKNCHIDLKELTSRQYKVFMKDLEKEGLYGMYKKAKLGAMKGGVVGRMIGGIGGGTIIPYRFLDIPVAHPFSVKRENLTFYTGNFPLIFWNNLRFKFSIPVPWNIKFNVPVFTSHSLLRISVP